MRSPGELKSAVMNADRKARALLEVWIPFRDAILRAGDSHWFASVQYSCKQESDIELHFHCLASQWYVRFHHDLQSGSIEYGALLTGIEVGRVERVMVHVLTFDSIGCVRDAEDDDEDVYILNAPELVHLDFLATHAPRFLSREMMRKAMAGIPEESPSVCK